ncbi:MAG TPA: hypothetical protein DD719_08345 [Desulfotomaculum sp.]|nr:hypothetical protein [Desulfotomaculum sp.]
MFSINFFIYNYYLLFNYFCFKNIFFLFYNYCLYFTLNLPRCSNKLYLKPASFRICSNYNTC